MFGGERRTDIRNSPPPAWVKCHGVIARDNFSAQPLLHRTVSRVERTQAISNDLAFARIFPGSDFCPDLVGHLIRQSDAELLCGPHDCPRYWIGFNPIREQIQWRYFPSQNFRE